MARPKPTQILQGPIGRTRRTITINSAPGYWIVTYQDQAISVITTDQLVTGKKYIKTGFAYPSFAQRLADRLNRIFATDEFDIKKVV
jgi:hypothetical protein